MRILGAVLLLIVLAAGVWIGGQWLVHRDDITATVVFTKAPKLRPGDPVKEDERTIGHVTSIAAIGERHAVTIRLNRDDRRSIVTDSLFDVKDHALVVDNGVAVGSPIADGAILEVSDDRFARWLSQHAAAAKPYIASIRSHIGSISDRDFTEWTKNVPDWKKEGREAFDRHVDDVHKKVADAEAQLKSSNRVAEAQKLKDRFEQWVREVGR